ncbi:MAG: LppX_LprAFG lipoprotein [Nocardioides sp.]
MRRPLLRRSLAAAAATTMLLGLAACGGDEPDTASEEPSVAESESSDEEDADASEPAEGEVVDNAEFIDEMMAGLEASTTANMSMDMDFGGGNLSAEGMVDYTTDPVSMSMTMNQEAMGEESIEMRLVDGIMYMNMGSMSNNKFMSFDLSDPASMPPGMGDLGDQMDPLAAFQEFEPALKTVTFVGDEEVDGEELRHFDVVMDTAKLESLKDLPAEAGLPDEVGYDLWFDDEMRIRQMEMVMDMATPVSVEAKLFDWDEPVEIVAPPEDEIAEQPAA